MVPVLGVGSCGARCPECRGRRSGQSSGDISMVINGRGTNPDVPDPAKGARSGSADAWFLSAPDPWRLWAGSGLAGRASRYPDGMALLSVDAETPGPPIRTTGPQIRRPTPHHACPNSLPLASW